MFGKWMDVCLIMVLVVVCVWLRVCVMTLSDRLCTAECGICGSSMNGCCLGICRGFVNRGVYPVRFCVLCVCETVILSCSMDCDVNCSCGLCWTLVWHVCFFFFFLFHVQVLRNGIHAHGSFHYCHPLCSSLPHSCLFTSSSFSSSSSLLTALSSSIFLSAPLGVASAPSRCVRFSHSLFFPLPAPLALPPSRGGTVMFMKPFNVLCNYPGNTSHHYSCQ